MLHFWVVQFCKKITCNSFFFLRKFFQINLGETCIKDNLELLTRYFLIFPKIRHFKVVYAGIKSGVKMQGILSGLPNSLMFVRGSTSTLTRRKSWWVITGTSRGTQKDCAGWESASFCSYIHLLSTGEFPVIKCQYVAKDTEPKTYCGGKTV